MQTWIGRIIVAVGIILLAIYFWQFFAFLQSVGEA